MSTAPSRLAALALLSLAPGASAATWFVDAGLATGANDGTSWADAFQGPHGLVSALAAATGQDEIFIAEGTYLPTSTGSRTESFVLETAVRIYGGFVGTETAPEERPPFGSAPSVLSGDLAGDDASLLFGENSYHVVRIPLDATTILLDGLVIAGGNANSNGDDGRGGGMLSLGGGGSLVRSCLFVGNRAALGGGGAYLPGGGPDFEDCSFVDNACGLGGGGGVSVFSSDEAGFDRCRFSGNRAQRGGAIELLSTLEASVSNSLFVANRATGPAGGGALWIGNTAAQLQNLTVVGNRSLAGPAAGLLASSGSCTVRNSILYDNLGPGGARGPENQVLGTADVQHSIVEGGLPGPGNLDEDPQFVDPDGGDWSLLESSPAIDAGDNLAVPVGLLLDLAGNPRFADIPTVPDTGSGGVPIVDIGAFERQATVALAYCFGDGSGTPCPCANAGAGDSGCANNSFAAGCALQAFGLPSVSADTLFLRATRSTPGQPGVFFQGDNAVAGGAGVAFGDGLRCAGGNVVRIQVRIANGMGVADSTASIPAIGGLTGGEVRRYQWWYRDPTFSPCGTAFNLSNGLEVSWTP